MKAQEYVLVTGIAGFIGSHVARKFLSQGYCVVGVDDLSQGKESNIPRGAEFIKADLNDDQVYKKLPKGCLYILHLAGQSSGEISFDDPVLDIKKNTISTLNLIRWGMAGGSKKIVYASSMSVYGKQPDQPVHEEALCQPLSCYGVGKLASEWYLKIYSKYIPSVALRMFNVYGPGQDMDNLRQGMVSIYLAQALQGGSIQVKGSIERYRDFVDVRDVAKIWWQATHLDLGSFCVLNVGTGVRTRVKELLEAIVAQLPQAKWFCEGTTPGDQFGIYADASNLRSLLGIGEFITLQEGLEEFVPWAKERITNIHAGATR